MKKTLLLLPLMIISFSCNQDDEANVKPESQENHWNYEHTNWYATGYPECGGMVQSPVDIDTKRTIPAQLADIVFHYSETELAEMNNGHTVEIKEMGTNSIEINGTTYSFKQMHFHEHSEHSVDGKHAAMELHLVHEDEQTGSLAVLGVFLEPGKEHALFGQVLDHLPARKDHLAQTGIRYKLSDWLPASKAYYTYIGSLTTPPCSQGIQWLIFKEPVQVSEAQIKAFTSKYHHNARPTQALNGRIVYEQKGI